MSVFHTAIQFFKTWFLPLPAHDEAEHLSEPLHRLTAEPEPAPDPEPGAQASYAVPPVPATLGTGDQDQQKNPDNKTDPAPADAGETDSAEVQPPVSPKSSDFSHLVRPPESADMRYSRRRIEGSDPGAFE